jgi:VCBS repeat-containing protein
VGLAPGGRIESTFSYDVSDGRGGIDTRRVTYTILAPGVRPLQRDLTDERDALDLLSGRRKLPPIVVRNRDPRRPTDRPAPGQGGRSAAPLEATAAAAAATGLWDDSFVPAVLADPDTTAIEVGVKFSADVAGSITGIRFYKSTTNTGTHTGTLWTATGTPLANVTFTGETASGWQTATFATPVAISPGTTYVASYHAPNGRYSVNENYFTAARTNGPLTAPSSATSGGNGVYRYTAASAFPNSSFAASNYWVDVLFEPGAPVNRAPAANDDSGLATAAGATLRIPYATLLANDSDPDGDTVNITAVSAGAGGTVALDTAASEVVFTPAAGFQGIASFTYTAADPGGLTDNAAVSVTVGTPPTTASLWPTSTIPTVQSANDTGAVELGVKFRASVNGSITGIRFYKGSLNTGTHVGNLWTSTGTRLGTVTFSNESASGWQTATFANPVPITAGTTYVASYFAPNGRYAIDSNYFANARTNGPLTAPSSADAGGNGVYAYGGASQFPTGTFNAANYWVDVVFSPASINNQPPTAGNDTATTNEDTPIVINVLANDSDPEGQPLQVTQLNLTGTQGNVTINPNNTISYAPGGAFQTLDAGESATDVFSYTVTDVNGATAQAAVQVTVTGVNDVVNDIVLENQRTGNPQSEWGISGPTTSIEGFATDISVNRGGRVGFKINTTSNNYRLDIYRMGYYGGMGARKVATVEPSLILPGGQPAPQTNAATGLVDAGNWAETAAWNVPADAVSGVYFAKLVREDGVAGSNHVYFIVRNDSSGSDMVFQTSDTTWHAYNQWGGNSLYTGQPAGRAFKVSYNRPFGSPGHPVNSPLFDSEYPMIRWLEANGYDLSYITNVDTARNGANLQDHDVFLSVGHDEYWSAEQRANVEAARDAGVNLAFFSANELYWKTRWESDSQGRPFRTLVSYKETWANAKIDPNPAWTGTWRDPRFSPPSDGGRPENQLTGTIYTVDSYRLDTMTIPSEYGRARFWRNTSVNTLPAGQAATLTPNVLGYEWDEDLNNGFRPQGAINLSSTTINVPAYIYDHGNTVAPGTGTHQLTLYRAPSGALVFGAGTTRWSWGLDSNHINESSSVDPRMQQATVNLFADMGVQPATLQPGLVPASASTDHTAPVAVRNTPGATSSVPLGSIVTISGTASDVGGIVAGVEVSTDGGATWREATGRTAWSYSWQPSQTGTFTVLSRAVDDSANIGAPSAPAQVTVTAPTGGWSFWTNNVVPSLPAANDPSAVELGVKFRSSTAGFVTGIKFYKGTGNTGTHVGSIWNASGTRLAQVTFTGETATGWQTASFATPVQITPNTTYVASYHAPNGRYAASTDYFVTPTTTGPLTAMASPDVGGNGVYRYGASAFPTDTFRSTNYWVDIVFNESLPA